MKPYHNRGVTSISLITGVQMPDKSGKHGLQWGCGEANCVDYTETHMQVVGWFLLKSRKKCVQVTASIWKGIQQWKKDKSKVFLQEASRFHILLLFIRPIAIFPRFWSSIHSCLGILMRCLRSTKGFCEGCLQPKPQTATRQAALGQVEVPERTGADSPTTDSPGLKSTAQIMFLQRLRLCFVESSFHTREQLYFEWPQMNLERNQRDGQLYLWNVSPLLLPFVPELEVFCLVAFCGLDCQRNGPHFLWDPFHPMKR